MKEVQDFRQDDEIGIGEHKSQQEAQTPVRVLSGAIGFNEDPANEKSYRKNDKLQEQILINEFCEISTTNSNIDKRTPREHS
jgi:hypothetical protein